MKTAFLLLITLALFTGCTAPETWDRDAIRQNDTFILQNHYYDHAYRDSQVP